MKYVVKFFKKFINSVYDINVFSNYIKEGLIRAIIYSIIMTSLVASFKIFFVIYNVNNQINMIAKEFEDKYFFYIDDGILNASDDNIIINKNDILVYVNDKENVEEAWKFNNKLYNPKRVVLFLKNGVVINNHKISYKIKYENFFRISKIEFKELKDFLYNVKVIMSISIIKMMISDKIYSMIINCFIVTLIVSIISIFMKMIVKYTALYSLVLYAATLPFIIQIMMETINLRINLDSIFIVGTTVYTIFILQNIKVQILEKNSK